MPESISTEIRIRGTDDTAFVFPRSIKKRPKPVPRAFDVEYRLSHPAAHPDSTTNGCKVLRTVAQVKDFLLSNDLPVEAVAEFDFSQRYGENGEMTEHGRKAAAGGGGRGRGTGKRKASRLYPPKTKKQRVAASDSICRVGTEIINLPLNALV